MIDFSPHEPTYNKIMVKLYSVHPHHEHTITKALLVLFADALWNKEGANAITSLVQLSLSPLDDSALALYHKVFRESIQGTAKPSMQRPYWTGNCSDNLKFHYPGSQSPKTLSLHQCVGLLCLH